MTNESNIPESLWKEINTEAFEEDRFGEEMIFISDLKKILERFFSQDTIY